MFDPMVSPSCTFFWKARSFGVSTVSVPFAVSLPFLAADSPEPPELPPEAPPPPDPEPPPPPAGVFSTVSLATNRKYSPICSTTALPGTTICGFSSWLCTLTTVLIPGRRIYCGFGNTRRTSIAPVCGSTARSINRIFPV